jgi:23S rRNA (guanine745-N1)-methyltransferase
MLRARRRFLDAGYYAPLATAVSVELGAWLRESGLSIPTEARTLVDCGCGEGFYLSQLANQLEDDFLLGDWRLYGFDIARDAVRLATSRSYGATGATLFVASMWEHLPFADADIGAALVIFAPRNPTELARVIAPGGRLLIVTPAPDHLAEARAVLPWLLAPEPEKDARLRAALTPAFTLASAQPARFSLALDATALADLSEMAPHRVPRADDGADSEAARQATIRAAVEAMPNARLVVTASCVISAFLRVCA